jgi:hypothetical protein
MLEAISTTEKEIEHEYVQDEAHQQKGEPPLGGKKLEKGPLPARYHHDPPLSRANVLQVLTPESNAVEPFRLEAENGSDPVHRIRFPVSPDPDTLPGEVVP